MSRIWSVVIPMVVPKRPCVSSKSSNINFIIKIQCAATLKVQRARHLICQYNFPLHFLFDTCIVCVCVSRSMKWLRFYVELDIDMSMYNNKNWLWKMNRYLRLTRPFVNAPKIPFYHYHGQMENNNNSNNKEPSVTKQTQQFTYFYHSHTH